MPSFSRMRLSTEEAFSRVLAAGTGRLLEAGHSVERIRNGEIFDALERELAQAHTSIHIVMYSWKPGQASDRVVRALLERRRAGVAVRVVVERLGARGGFTEQVLPVLKEAGCEVQLKTAPRNHRKIIVIDGQTALVGGWCVWDRFLGDGRGEESWRDTGLVIRGPSVRFMQEAFLHNWREANGALPPLAELPWPKAAPSSGDGVRTGFVHCSGGEEGVTSARALMTTLLPAAFRRLWIECAYFTPDEPLKNILCERARCGVDVRVLVPGPIHDAPPVRELGRALYPELLEAGVRVYEYQPSMLHSKTVLVDDELCVVGSINLEPLSVDVLEEGAAVLWTEDLALELAADFEEDLAFAKEMTLEELPQPEVNHARRALRWAGGLFANVVRGVRRREQESSPLH